MAHEKVIKISFLDMQNQAIEPVRWLSWEIEHRFNIHCWQKHRLKVVGHKQTGYESMRQNCWEERI